MWEVAALLGFAGLIWFGSDSLRARERALEAARRSCDRHGLQFLDEGVHCIHCRPTRNELGRMRLRRVYRFEFTDNGDSRRLGHVTLLGNEIEAVTLDPYLH